MEAVRLGSLAETPWQPAQDRTSVSVTLTELG